MMRKTIVVMVIAFTALVSCARRPANDGVSQGTTLRLWNDGKETDRTIKIEGANGLETVRKEAGGFTGHFELSTRVERKDGAFSQDCIGELVNGYIQGVVKNYLTIDGKRTLTASIEFHKDGRNGVSESYYPFSDRLQMRGSYENGKKNGKFVILYRSGRLAASIDYKNDLMDGLCEVKDKAGNLLASGNYHGGARESGTFVDNFDAYIHGVLDEKEVVVRIVRVGDGAK